MPYLLLYMFVIAEVEIDFGKKKGIEKFAFEIGIVREVHCLIFLYVLIGWK